jgi:hypothetical protein
MTLICFILHNNCLRLCVLYVCQLAPAIYVSPELNCRQMRHLTLILEHSIHLLTLGIYVSQ